MSSPGAGADASAAGAAPSAAAIRRARRFRLTPDVRPNDVDIHLEIDPNRPTFRGHVAMGLVLERGSRTLTLHAAELEPSRARALIGERAADAEIEIDPLREVMRLRFARPLPRGPVRVEIEFEGRVRDDLEGLYRVECGGQRFAFSQLCTTRARNLFPCFDEPGFKARYALTVATPAPNDVVSNMPVASMRVDTAGHRTFEFERTPLLSTYLLTVAVGELERSPVATAGETPITVITTPGKTALTDIALDVAQRALPVLEAWFGIPYPYPKLDLVAVPDFSFGAMENAGAVFFRETLLLADPATTSFDERKRLTETICHELAHMWFGNLVTMAWWDDLWLNESFATWMAFHVVDQIWPEWSTWQTFQHRKDAALDLDALAHTHPVYVPVASAEEANENFDLITYEKGASVIRMLAGYLGAEAFRDGVRRYLEANLEDNAVAADLWSALETVSDVPVARIMRAWVERAGHPRVRIERSDAAGEPVFRLSQTLHQTVPARRARATEQRSADETPWPVPVIARIGDAQGDAVRTERLLLEPRDATLSAQNAGWIHGNAGEAGFYRPWLDEAQEAALRSATDRLEPVERQGLVGHTWALVQATVTPVASLLALIEALGDERDPDVLKAIVTPVTLLSRGLVHDLSPDTAPAFRGWVEATFSGALDAVGFADAAARAPVHDSRRRARAELLALVGGVAERTSVVEAAPGWAARVLDGDASVDAELTVPWLSIAAAHGDAALYDRCVAALQHVHTPQGRQRALFALTEFTRPELIAETLDRCATGRVSSQDLVFVLGRLLAHPKAQAETWSFIRARWAEIAAHLPGMHVPRLIAATPALRSSAHRREVSRFFKSLDLPSTRRAIDQATERFEAQARLRAHAGADLERWLAARS